MRYSHLALDHERSAVEPLVPGVPLVWRRFEHKHLTSLLSKLWRLQCHVDGVDPGFGIEPFPRIRNVNTVGIGEYFALTPFYSGTFREA